MNKWTFSIAYFLGVVITTLLFHWWLSSEHGEVIAYSDFKRLAQNGKVLDAEIGDRTITANVDLSGTELVTSTPTGFKRTYRGPGRRDFTTFRVSDPALISELQAQGVRFSAARSSHWVDEILSLLIPAAAFIGIWFYVVHRLKSRSS